MIKFTKLEVQTITDRPEECIVEHLCQDQNGKRNQTEKIWVEQIKGYNDVLWDNNVYPEQMTYDAIYEIYGSLEKKGTLPEPITDLHKKILDNCISMGTWDRADEVSPQFWGAVKRAVKNIATKFEKLDIELTFYEDKLCL